MEEDQEVKAVTQALHAWMEVHRVEHQSSSERMEKEKGREDQEGGAQGITNAPILDDRLSKDHATGIAHEFGLSTGQSRKGLLLALPLDRRAIKVRQDSLLA